MLVVGIVLVIVVVWCATTLGEIEIEGTCFRVKKCSHRGRGIMCGGKGITHGGDGGKGTCKGGEA